MMILVGNKQLATTWVSLKWKWLAKTFFVEKNQII